MKTWKRTIKNAALTATLLVGIFVLALILQRFFDAKTVTPMLFVLGVFLVSLYTEGYAWGVAASLVGVLAVNYAFMFPYYAIDLLTPVNMATAVVMLAVSIMTSTLTSQISIHQQEKAAAERERMRANLLRAISHDLRTPLTSIYGACSVLIDHFGMLPEEKQMTLLNDMRKDADWLIRMVENLLSVTRIDEKTKPISKTPTVLEELIDSVLVKFYKHYPDQPVEVTIPDEFVSIPMDALLIEQVLMNLLENAVVHASGMTRLELKVSTSLNKAKFCILDNGCGIAPDRLEKLFNGCMEHDQKISDGKRSGMGIGLFVCASIIRAHGGEMKAVNRPGGGAAFSFELYMEEKHEQ